MVEPVHWFWVSYMRAEGEDGRIEGLGSGGRLCGLRECLVLQKEWLH